MRRNIAGLFHRVPLLAVAFQSCFDRGRLIHREPSIGVAPAAASSRHMETKMDLQRSGLLFLLLGTAAASAQEKAATPPAQTQPASSGRTARKRSSDDAGKERADAVKEREAERRAERRERRRERRHAK